MANSDNAFGLRPVGDLSGAPYQGAVMRCFATDSTAIYLGGLVKPTGSGDAAGVIAVTGNVSTGDAVLGVVVGVEPVTNDSTIYREASVDRYVNVAVGPNLLCEVQEDGTGAVTDIGSVADLTGLTSGSTTTGRSSIEISSSSVTASGDGTEDVLILGIVQRPDVEVGEFGKYIVRLNNHFLVDAQTGT